MNILLTGATGFVGKALLRKLTDDGHRIFALVRKKSEQIPPYIEQIITADISNLSSEVRKNKSDIITRSEDEVLVKLREALRETDVIVHTAARVHVMNERSNNPLNLFRRVNSEATLALARMAAEAGVKRFVFLSTVKVNGESTSDRAPFSESDICQPDDPYAISKWEAEQGLFHISSTTPMESVIIRAPLIYGPGVKGNFATLYKFIEKGFPLPLASIKNQRSLLALDNLLSFINICLTHQMAANEIFLLSDDRDVSTPELVKCLADAQGKSALLLPLPVFLLRFLAFTVGKKAFSERLLGSLCVDVSKAKSLLDWKPVVTMQQQLSKTR